MLYYIAFMLIALVVPASLLTLAVKVLLTLALLLLHSLIIGAALISIAIGLIDRSWEIRDFVVERTSGRHSKTQAEEAT
jgi:hypothetical protein